LKIFGEKIRYKIISVAMEAFMKKEPNRRLSPAIEQYAEAITGTLRKEFKKVNIDPKGMTLQIEPGRSLYGDTAVHLTRVLKTKYQTKPIKMNWVLLDTTYFFMAGGVFENNLYDFLVANDADRKPVKNADVCGKSCFADRLLPEVRIPDVDPGDIFAILDTGAYQEVSASNFNALPRPATILVHGDQAEVIKHAETIQDIFRRDVVPKRLLKK
jgi:diaminopimelate decarboxylase